MKRYSASLLSILIVITSLFSGAGMNPASGANSILTSYDLIGKRSTNGIFYSDVQLEFKVQSIGSENVVTRYSLNDGNDWINYTTPIQFSEKKVYHILYQSVAKNGEEEPKSLSFTIKRDQIPPESKLEVIGVKGENSYYVSPVHISLSAEDFHSYVEYTEYSLTGGRDWKRYTDPVLIEDENNKVIYYRSKDINGNLEKPKKFKLNLDFSGPTAPDFAITPTEWSNSSFKVTLIDGVDKKSGTMKSQYKIGTASAWTDYTSPFPVEGNGEVVVYGQTIDYAGNTSEIAEVVLKFDKTPPTKPVVGLSNDDWSNEPVLVSIYGGEDEESKVSRYEYKIGTDEEWTTYLDSFSITQEGITPVYGRTVDKAGNASVPTKEDVKIDLTAPSAPEALFKVSQLGNSVYIRWTPGIDNLSGVTEYEVYSGDTLLDVTSETKFKLEDLKPGEEYSITIKSVDRAGNVSVNSSPMIIKLSDINVSAYRDHSFAWNPSGQVWGWGLNNLGQLGDGTRKNKNVATLTSNLNGMAMIATGFRQNIGLKQDGTVWTWGEDSRGNSISLSQVETLENIVSIAAGLDHYLALKEDGTIWAWGHNGVGQLGNGTHNDSQIPIQVANLNSVVAITAGYYNSMALLDDGTVWIWGDSQRGLLGYTAPQDYNQVVPLQVSGLSNVTQIDLSHLHAAALKNDGTVWTWGFNSTGQLGDGTVKDHANPRQVSGLTDVAKIATAYDHSLALTKDGKVWSWGSNTSGQLGDGTDIQQRLSPIRVAHLEGIVDIEVGEMYNFAIKQNGSVWSWGNNMYGQLGDGTVAKKNTRVLVQGIPVPTDTSAPSAPSELTLMGKTSNTAVLYWKESIDNHGVKEYLIYKDGSLLTTIGVDGKSIDSTIEYAVTGLAAGTTYKFTVRSKDYAGNLSPVSNEVSVTTEHAFPMNVSAGSNHTLALKSDGSVWAWGSNNSGQLGIQSGTVSSSPRMISDINSVTAITTGNAFSLALRSDGTVWAWGQNTIGQLGNTALTPQQRTPKRIEGLTNVTAISAGSMHALALRSDGTVWAWGSNMNGELGIGSTSNSYTPVKINSLTDVKSISAGMFYSIAVKTDGTVWVWGANYSGQLGDGTSTNRTLPYRLTGISQAKSASAGEYHALVLKEDGTVWAWGQNNYGQLGDGTYSSRMSPTKVQNLNNIKQVSAGMYHSMARSETTLYTWGDNNYGQLGNNSTASSKTPVAVSSLSEVIDLDAGSQHGGAVTKSKLFMWGSNNVGQLGNGSTSNSRIPVIVNGLVPTKKLANVQMKTQSEALNIMPTDQDNLILPDSFKLPDLIAPSTPENVVAQIKNGSLNVKWDASTDNIGVKEYYIYANHDLILKTKDTFANLKVSNSSYTTFTIRAVDDAGNLSQESVPVTP